MYNWLVGGAEEAVAWLVVGGEASEMPWRGFAREVNFHSNSREQRWQECAVKVTLLSGEIEKSTTSRDTEQSTTKGELEHCRVSQKTQIMLIPGAVFLLSYDPQITEK